MNKNEMIRWAIMTLLPSRLFIVFTLAVLTFGVAFCDTSFTVQVGTAYTAKPPLLWNKLGSFNEVEHSEIGQNLESYGDLVFNPCKFGNGITPREGGAQAYASIQDSGIFNPESGAVELWMYLYDYPLGWEYGVYGFVNVIHDDANSNPLILSYYNDFYGTGNIGMHLKFGAAQAVPLYLFNLEYLPPLLTPVHLAFVWNRSGIDGTPDTMRIYVDGTLMKSSTENNWGTTVYTGETTVASKIAPAWDLNYTNDRYAMDNIKVWDYAKTDYSDRNTEGITTSDTFAATKSFTIQEGVPALLGSLQSFLGISPSMFSGIDGSANTTISWSNPSVGNAVFMLSNTVTGVVAPWTGALSMARDDMVNYAVYVVADPIQIMGVENGKQYRPGRAVNVLFATGCINQEVTLDGQGYTSGTTIDMIGTHTIVASCVNSIGIQITKTVTFEIVPAQMPSAPYGVSTRLSLSEVRLAWSADQKPLDIAYPITGYKIYRSDFGGSPYQIGTIGSATTFVDSGIVPGYSYTYHIATLDSMGNESEMSTGASVNSVANMIITYDPVIKTRTTTVNAQFVDSMGNPVNLDTVLELQCVSGGGLVDGEAGAVNKTLNSTSSFSYSLTAGPEVGNNIVRIKNGSYERTDPIFAGEVTLQANTSANAVWKKEFTSGTATISISAVYGGRNWDGIPLSYSSSYGSLAGGAATGSDGTATAVYTPTTFENIQDDVIISSPATTILVNIPFIILPLPESVSDTEGDAIASCFSCSSVGVESEIQAFTENPVNTYTGNLLYSVMDVSVQTLGFPIYVSRTYNSLNPKPSIIGYGWTFNYNERLLLGENGIVYYVRADGAHIPFTDDGTHTNYTSMPGNTDHLYIDIAGSYRLDFKQRFSSIFDNSGNRIKIIDKNKNETYFEYNVLNQLTRVYEPTGKSISFTYHGSGCIATVQDPLGIVYTYSYDEQTNLISVVAGDYHASYEYGANHTLIYRSDPKATDKAKTRRYAYDRYNRVIEESDAANADRYSFSYDLKEITPGVTNIVTVMTDEMGKVLRHVYNSHGVLVAKYDTDGTSEKYEFGNGVSLTKYIDKNGNTNSYNYNERFQKTRFIDPLGNITSYVYDDMCVCDAVIALTNALGYLTQYEYDDNQNLTKTVYPDGSTEIQHYNTVGLMEYSIDKNGNRINYEYDGYGNLTRIQYPPVPYLTNRVFTEYSYDALGRRTLVRDMNGNLTRYLYNVMGLVTNVVSADGSSVSLLYDSLGRTVSTIDEEGYSNQSAYDLHDRLTERTDPLGFITRYAYAPNGKKVQETDPRGHSRAYEYTDSYRLKAIHNADGYVKSFSYDSNGNVVGSTNERGFGSRKVYDGNNKVVEELDSLTNKKTYSYDSLGRVIKIIDYDGKEFSMTYDVLGHITNRTDKTGISEQTYYDRNGNVVVRIDKNKNQTTFGYDALNRLIAVTNALSNVTRYEYDGNGNRTRIIDPLGNETHFYYDVRNKVIEKKDALGVSSFTYYDRRGLATNVVGKGCTSCSKGANTRYVYDGKRQVVETIDCEGYSTRFEYDENGNRKRTTDRRGNATSYSYDKLNRIISIVDALNHENIRIYDEAGNLTNAIGKSGNSISYQFDAMNRVVSTRFASGGERKYEYDPMGRRIRIVDEAGYETRLEYNAVGKLIGEIDALSNKISMRYDSNGNMVERKDKREGSTRYLYDSLNRRISIINALSNEQKIMYDSAGRVSAVIDYGGHTNYRFYDAVGNLIRTVDKAGNETRMSYDDTGRMLLHVDAMGNRTAYVYDKRNRVIAITNALQDVVRKEYDANGNIVTRIDARGYETHFTYDALNRLTNKTDALGNAIRYEYDPDGRLVQIIDANGYITRYAHNERGSITNAIDDEGNEQRYEYDERGLRTRIVNAAGRSTVFEYDALRRMVKRIDALGNIVRSAYDENGRLTNVLDAHGGMVAYTYDMLGRRTGVEDGIGNTTTYRYDDDGNEIEKATPAGERFTYNRDILGRITNEVQKSTNGSLFQSIVYEYDALRHVTKIKDSVMEMDFAYDALGRRVSETAKIGVVDKTMRLVYDENGNRTRMIDYEGRTNDYVYDPVNRLTNITAQSIQSGDVIGAIYAYDASGYRTNMTINNGMTMRFMHDSAYRITNISYLRGGELSAITGAIDSIGYSYDTAGNIVRQTTRDGTEQYAYDDLDRITNVSYGDSSFEQFTYDAAGNRTFHKDNDSETHYTYDAANRLLTENTALTNGNTIEIDYAYNRSGAITLKEELVHSGIIIDTNRTTFDYLPDGRLASVNDSQTNTVTNAFTYSSMLRRIAKVDSAGTNIFLYDGPNAIYVYDEQMRIRKHYVHGLRIDTPIAVEVQQTNGMVKRYYHLADERGNVRYLVNDKREIVQTYRYKVFGSPKISGKDINIYTYTGREYDNDYGLYYYRSRHYDPRTGRFTRVDDKRNGLNWYVYANNNPLKHRDPLGYDPGCPEGDCDPYPEPGPAPEPPDPSDPPDPGCFQGPCSEGSHPTCDGCAPDCMQGPCPEGTVLTCSGCEYNPQSPCPDCPKGCDSDGNCVGCPFECIYGCDQNNSCLSAPCPAECIDGCNEDGTCKSVKTELCPYGYDQNGNCLPDPIGGAGGSWTACSSMTEYSADCSYCGPGQSGTINDLISGQFNHACYTHDKCYKYSSDQSLCDLTFLNEMIALCENSPNLGAKALCLVKAALYYEAASGIFGGTRIWIGKFFDGVKRKICP